MERERSISIEDPNKEFKKEVKPPLEHLEHLDDKGLLELLENHYGDQADGVVENVRDPKLISESDQYKEFDPHKTAAEYVKTLPDKMKKSATFTEEVEGLATGTSQFDLDSAPADVKAFIEEFKKDNPDIVKISSEVEGLQTEENRFESYAPAQSSEEQAKIVHEKAKKFNEQLERQNPENFNLDKEAIFIQALMDLSPELLTLSRNDQTLDAKSRASNDSAHNFVDMAAARLEELKNMPNALAVLNKLSNTKTPKYIRLLSEINQKLNGSLPEFPENK